MEGTMEYQRIQNPTAFFRRLGGLHDAEIQRIAWSDGAITVAVDDLYANFLGEPEYRGPQASSVRFSGIREASLELDSSASDRVTVYSWSLSERAAGGGLEVTVRLAPGGLIHVICMAIAADFDSSSVAI